MQYSELRKAFKIGSVCVASYIVSYYMRNVLSVLTPEMLATGLYTKEYIGLLSSLYFCVYAAGQLINGMTGDYIKPKKMTACGLVLSGCASILFVFLDSWYFQMICFGVMGFGLSMLRGPLMKVISENTLPKYARIICVFFSVASFLGAFVASFLALLFKWRAAFIVSGIIALAVAAVAYILFSYMEKRGMLHNRLAEKVKLSEMLKVFKLDGFAFYMFIGVLVEIASSSINFWIPTYLTEYLRFNVNHANLIFSIISLLKVVAPFIALGLFKIIGERDIVIVKYSFLMATIFFILMAFVNNVWMNIILFLIARISVGCASAMLWSIYIPSLGKTGKVSSANGILDCTGYIGASIANVVFGSIVDSISWNGVIFVWSGIMFAGFLVAAIVKFYNRKNA